jgi:hypothetical protein
LKIEKLSIKLKKILRQRKLMKQKMKLAAEKFNNKPLKNDWILYAVECGILNCVEIDSNIETNE